MSAVEPLHTNRAARNGSLQNKTCRRMETCIKKHDPKGFPAPKGLSVEKRRHFLGAANGTPFARGSSFVKNRSKMCVFCGGTPAHAPEHFGNFYWKKQKTNKSKNIHGLDSLARELLGNLLSMLLGCR